MLELRILGATALGAQRVIDLPGAVRLVAVVGKMLRERNQIRQFGNCAKPRIEAVNAGRTRTHADHDAGPGRIADRRLDVRVREQRPPVRQPVDVWRLDQRVPAHAADPVVLIVDGDEQHVGLRRLGMYRSDHEKT